METVRKKLPYELYDVAGLEDWFSRMAAGGLHLRSCGSDKAEFEQGVPAPGVRYRLEAQGTYETDLNKNSEYGQAGWEHVTTIRGFFYVFRCDDPAAQELHTDPEIQSWTMKKLMRRQWGWFIFWPLYWAFILRDEVKVLFTAPVQLAMEYILRDGVILACVYALTGFLYLIGCQVVQVAALSRLCRRLASGQPMDRSRRYPRSFWRHGALVVFVVLGFGLMLVFPLLDGRTDAAFDLADYPHVTLEELLPGEEIGPAEQSVYSVGAELETSFLAPVQLTFGDRGAVRDGKEERVIRVYLRYYETRSDTVAGLLLESCKAELQSSFVEHGRRTQKNLTLLEPLIVNTGPVLARHEAYDTLYVWDYQYEDAEPQRCYFARMGNKTLVMHVSLSQPELALEAMAAKLREK